MCKSSFKAYADNLQEAPNNQQYSIVSVVGFMDNLTLSFGISLLVDVTFHHCVSFSRLRWQATIKPCTSSEVSSVFTGFS